MKHILFLACIMLAGTLVRAQEGWIALHSGDTLKGKIGFLIKGPYQMDEVQVKYDKKKERYNPTEVRRIRKKNNEYIPIKLDGKFQFALVEKEGYVSRYRYVNPESSGYEDFSLTVLTKKGGDIRQISNLFFFKSVQEFLGDCRPLMAKIENKEYTAKDLDEIIDFYNAWMESKGVSTPIERQKENIDKIVAINEMIEAVELDKQLSGNTELLDMLADIKSKFAEGKAIPGYLSAAVKESLNGNDQLLTQFNKLLERED